VDLGVELGISSSLFEIVDLGVALGILALWISSLIFGQSLRREKRFHREGMSCFSLLLFVRINWV